MRRRRWECGRGPGEERARNVGRTQSSGVWSAPKEDADGVRSQSGEGLTLWAIRRMDCEWIGGAGRSTKWELPNYCTWETMMIWFRVQGVALERGGGRRGTLGDWES